MLKNKLIYSFSLVAIVIVLAVNLKGEADKVSAFSKGAALGMLEDVYITEASGMARSILNDGLFWTHNDSGNDPNLFLINQVGQTVAKYTLEGVPNRDWEDMAVGPGPVDGQTYIYLGEIGDNNSVYDDKFIYRFVEPNAVNPQTLISSYEKINFQFPDGNRDAETLMVDPHTKDIYILSKREHNVMMYQAQYPQSTSEKVTLEKVATLPYTLIVAGDISADGNEILLKTYDKVLYWKREKKEKIAEALQREAIEIPYIVEPQGESIAWDNKGSGFYTLSEERNGVEAVLYYYGRK